MEQVVTKYLKSLRVPVSKKYCERLIRSHPDYPSLLSISDTLQRLGIDHQAARISKEQLAGVEIPFLARLNANGGGFNLIENQKDLTEQLELNGHVGQPTAGRNSEEKAVVLMVDPAEEITDPENHEYLAKESFQRTLFITLLSATAGMVLLALVTFFSWIYLSLIATATAGAVVGYLLLARDVGVTYDPVETFCKAGKKVNCDTILRSDGARLFGKVSFTDGVASYFLFQLLVLGLVIPFARIAESFLLPLALLSVLAIPIVFFSLYYQSVNAKTWCRLCLIVDATLLVQAGLFGYMFYSGLIGISFLEPFPVVTSLLWFLLVTTSVLLLKDILKKANESERNEIQALRVKHSPEVFTNLLFQEKKVDTSPFEKELLIGNSKVPVQITMAASLSCGPCKDGFEKVKQLVSRFPETANLTVRFLQSRSDNGQSIPHQSTVLLNYWFYRIQGKGNESERTANLIRDWYSLMDIEKFKSKYSTGADGVSTHVKKLEENHDNWFNTSEIQGTPTFFINGYQLPKQYTTDDLMMQIFWLEDYF